MNQAYSRVLRAAKEANHKKLAAKSKKREKYVLMLALLLCGLFLFFATTWSLFQEENKLNGLQSATVQDIVERRKEIIEVERYRKKSQHFKVDVINDFGEITRMPNPNDHQRNAIKIGQGYCRVLGDYMPWETGRYCVKDFNECSDMCKMHKNCIGFAIAEKPEDNWDNCKIKKLARCVVYFEDVRVSHQMYASFTSDEDTYTKAYDCYRHGENKGFFYFPLSVTREGGSEEMEDWSLVLSTQGEEKLLAETGEGTATYGGLFEKHNGNYTYHFDWVLHWDEYLASYENMDPVFIFELVGEGRSEIYHARVLTGQKVMHGLLEHAKSTRKMTSGHFEFSTSDGEPEEEDDADLEETFDGGADDAEREEANDGEPEETNDTEVEEADDAEPEETNDADMTWLDEADADMTWLDEDL